MMQTATETTTWLLDLLEAPAGWDLINGGEVWTVTDWIAEWQAGVEAGDRGPAVAVSETSAGERVVIALDAAGRPAELVGLLTRLAAW